jgi:hypothetical protein
MLNLSKRLLGTALFSILVSQTAMAQDIVHDGEYNFVKAQYGDNWDKEDNEIDARLAEVRKKMAANDPTFSIS